MRAVTEEGTMIKASSVVRGNEDDLLRTDQDL